ncbi:TonB-dependent receptor [Maribacter polysiphoniae]|uniref:Outer membrane receptor protein involved in Fe transport n=1 Tax=Maribacter polysiphoniae TaxID=429344 RepID=A0A316E5V3_9FLAO|nr:TonB-dependent receptor [Maribacter polysiphoniae]MBD1260309.1 TonB-dependent receptor [Maribacter polysiphoniae]PWK25771.1 outer membrane receptor protein involved in Fe transport [Maribacter polysiphoniae]
MRAILFLSLMMLGALGFSQTTTSGTVVDHNNEPVPGANVIIVGKAVGAVSDFDGNFTLKTSETPPFQLKISSIGYTDTTVDVTSNNEKITIVLDESHTMLDEIVISASRTPERLFESPVSVERFGLKEIQNTTSASFYGGLENLKGVDVNTNSLTFQSINTRGFASFANTRFMQLVDGMDNSSPALNFVLGNLVGMNDLDVQSVEILPGASSALYGANAFNGILFMRSKSPFDFQGISSYLKTGITSQEAAGDNEYYDIGIRAAHAFSDKLAVKASFSFMEGTDWYAVSEEDLTNPGFTRTDPAYDGLNIYGDEVSTVLNFDTLAGLPPGTVGSALVSRTGYSERDLNSYDAQSVKFDGAIHYRPFADDFEIIYNGRVGRGSTIYQGANRYYIDGFSLQQHKLEFKNNNFFIRGYITAENAGDSYDTRFAGINVNRRWKGDTEWFTDYATTFIGAKLGVGTGVQLDDASAHAAARAAADTGRLIPGTPEFEATFNSVISDGDLTTGARFIDNTKLRHVDANYNFSHLTEDFADIQVGGSYREYELNSQGTIFTDMDGAIPYAEYGLYTQLQKKFMDERIKFTGSVRYDKNELFDGFVSPRASLTYTVGENRNHNFRGSFQTGFRNPTTQDLYIGLNAGRALLVGAAEDNLDRYVVDVPLSTNGAALVGSSTVTMTGRDAYENAYSATSVEQGAPAAVNTPLVKPEKVTALELGYRGQLGQVVIDISGYYNDYQDFISQKIVLAPKYGEAGDGGLSLLALQNGDYQPFNVYTNSLADITSYGVTAGLEAQVFGNFDFGVNYTFSDFDFDETSDPDFQPQFNTPKHKVKASFGNSELFENFGFNINYRWTDGYLWENSFATGDIPSFSVLDAQVNYSVPSIKSIFKLGASNLLGEEYVTAVGTGYIGSQFYLSWTINN